MQSGSMHVSGSEALWHSLLNHGVNTIFGYPGGAIMPVYDALFDFQDSIRHILVRHEQGAAHAAQGYARIKGRAGVCIATSGPGATNLVTGIADAMLDSVPIVCITGQVFKDLLGSDAFQEVDIISITIPITKWNYQITTAAEIAHIVAKAFYIAENGRPGPVLIDITKNAQIDKCDYVPETIKSIRNFTSKPRLKQQRVADAAALINEAQRPLILAGHGVLISDASKELQSLAELADIPVACTLHGLSSIPATSKQYVGMLGMHGNYAPNVLTNKADLLIAVGMRFDDRVTGKLSGYATEAKVIHIEIDAAEIHKNVPATIPLYGDAKDALQALLPLISRAHHDAWFAEFHKCYELELAKVINREIAPTSGKIKMAEVIHQLSNKTGGTAIVVGDVGQHQMTAARYYRFVHPDSWITSGGLGTMGFALPAAMGAAVAAPDRTVIAIIGDGCFQMTFQELGTIAQDNIPVKAVILNNNFLGMVRQWQELFFSRRYSFVDLKNPDFVALTKAFGIPAERVDCREELESAIERMLAHDGPYLLDVTCEKEGNVFPMMPTGATVSDIRLE